MMNINEDSHRPYLGHDARKTVFGVSDKARLKPVSSAEILLVHCSKLSYDTFQKANNKGAGQTARMRRLVCTFVVRKHQNTCFLVSRPICKGHL